MKSVKLEWCLGNIPKAKDLLEDSVKHYPDFPKVCIREASSLGSKMSISSSYFPGSGVRVDTHFCRPVNDPHLSQASFLQSSTSNSALLMSLPTQSRHLKARSSCPAPFYCWTYLCHLSWTILNSFFQHSLPNYLSFTNLPIRHFSMLTQLTMKSSV